MPADKKITCRFCDHETKLSKALSGIDQTSGGKGMLKYYCPKCRSKIYEEPFIDDYSIEEAKSRAWGTGEDY